MLRDQAVLMRNEGLKGLLSFKYKQSRDYWHNPTDCVESAILIYSLRHDHNSLDKLDITDKLDALKEYTLRNLFTFDLGIHSANDHVPVLRAATILHTLSSLSNAEFTQGIINSLFRIIYELNSHSNPDEMIGGACAGAPGVPQTAFITWWCVRAISSFVNAL